MKMHDLLIEIGTEELPPKALQKLSAAFLAGVRSGLEEAGLGFTTIKEYAAPRRLALLVEELEEKQADRESQRRGPALTAAFGDDGCPTKAAEGFARSCGVESVEELDRLETDKGAWLAYTVQETGKPAAELIPAIVQKSLDGLPIPKRMRKTRASRGASVASNSRVCSARLDWITASAGLTAFGSSMKSERRLSSSSPTGVSRLIGMLMV